MPALRGPAACVGFSTGVNLSQIQDDIDNILCEAADHLHLHLRMRFHVCLDWSSHMSVQTLMRHLHM